LLQAAVMIPMIRYLTQHNIYRTECIKYFSPEFLLAVLVLPLTGFFSESLLLSFVGVVICVPVQFITDQVPRITLASISMKRLYEFGEELGHLEKDIAGQETPIRNAEFRALRYEDIFFRYKEDKPIYVFDEWAADQDPHFRQYFYETLLPSFKKEKHKIIDVPFFTRFYIKREFGLNKVNILCT
jgi:hypothetical protein